MALIDKSPAVTRTVVLGRISAVYGIKGWVRVYSYTAPIEGLIEFSDCLLGLEDDWQPAEIAEAKRHGKGIIVRMAGIDDRDAAAGLIGKNIAVQRDRLPDTAEGSYYWADLEGLEVQRPDGTSIGRVAYLLETGANDVLVVAGEEEILIPFLYGTVVKQVDLDGGVIVVDWHWD